MKAPRALALCQCFNGALEFRVGNWEQAEQSLEQAIEMYRELDAASGEALSWQRLGVLQTARGDFDQALQSLHEGVAVAKRATMRAHCLARLYASMTENRVLAGDLEAAEDYLAAGMAMGDRHGNCATCDALLLPAAVQLEIRQRRLDTAQEFTEQLRRAAAEYGSRVWRAMAARAEGELAASRGKLDVALESLQDAHQLYSQSGNSYQAAWCQVLIGQVRRQRGLPEDRQAAERVLSRADEALDDLGAAVPASPLS